MPKINDYGQSQLNDQSQFVDNNSSLTQPGLTGKAMSKFGETVSEVGGAVYRRAAQEEVSNLNAQFAQAQSDWAQKLEDDTRNGTVNTQSARDQYQEYVSKMNENIQTSEGRSFFDRQSARLGGQIVKQAAHAQAQVAGDKAVANYTTALNLRSNMLQAQPSNFEDAVGASMDAIDAQVQSGAIPEHVAEKLRKVSGMELSKSAIRGWAKLDPNHADEIMSSGAYDQYITGETKSEMLGYINQERLSKEIEARKADAAQERARKLRVDAWEKKAMPEMAKGSLPTDDIINNKDLNAEEMVKWMKFNQERAKGLSETNHALKNELSARTLLPDDDPKKIRNISDLSQYVGKGINIADAEQISGFIDKTDDGKAMRDNQKRLMDFALTTLVKKDPLTLQVDPTGERNMAEFQIALQNEIATRKASKDPQALKDLFDPTKKDSFYNNVEKYKRTPLQIMQDMAKQMQAPQKAAATSGGPTDPPPPSADIQPPPAQGPEDLVAVTSPQGGKFKVKRRSLEAYKKQGFKER